MIDEHIDSDRDVDKQIKEWYNHLEWKNCICDGSCIPDGVCDCKCGHGGCSDCQVD